MLFREKSEQLKLRYLICAVYFALTVLSTVAASAAGLSCSELFTGKNSISKSDHLFESTDLDPEIPVLKSRANFLRHNGLLEVAKAVDKSYLSLQHLQRLIAAADGELNKISIFKPTIKNMEIWIRSRQLKKQLKVYREWPLDDQIPINEISKFMFECTRLISEWQHFLKNGKETFEALDSYESSDAYRILLNSIPILGSPHPESILYLATRNVFVWEFSTEEKLYDGNEKPGNPMVVAAHDSGHISELMKSVGSVPNGEQSYFFDRIWKDFINRPQQTLRERELAIFILHSAFFENSVVMTFEGLSQYLKYKERTYGNARGNLLYRLRNKNDLSSTILKEKRVEAEELEKVVSEMRAWLSSEIKENGIPK